MNKLDGMFVNYVGLLDAIDSEILSHDEMPVIKNPFRYVLKMAEVLQWDRKQYGDIS